MREVEGATQLRPGLQVDEESLNSIIQVLALEAPELPEDALKDIALQAIEVGKLNDRDWLEQKVSEARRALIPEPPKSIPVSEVKEIETQEQLRAVVARHQAWMDAVLTGKGPAEGRAVFRNLNLDGYDFQGVNLSCADFRYCSLIGCDFSGSNLSRAKFDGAILRSSVFAQSNLKGATFEGADMQGVDLQNMDSFDVVLSKSQSQTLRSSE